MPRSRDLGIHVGILSTGPCNAITDVAGVSVGHRTLVAGDDIRTGVTVILPHGDNLFQQKVPAAISVGNGFGKLAGVTQVEELGCVETPIALTNTLSVGAAVQALVRWTLSRPGNEGVGSVNAVVGETNDGYLNDIRGMHVTETDVAAAIDAASTGPVAEGCVGAGTGTSCFGYKGGIGTASRRLPAALGGWTVGVLTINGAPVGRELGTSPLSEYTQGRQSGGSCMIVLATDAALSARNLKRLAKRTFLGLGRTGSVMGNGSGDYAIAFATGYRIPVGSSLLEPPTSLVSNNAVSNLFLAVVEATEEAVYNSMFAATTTTGRDGHTREAIPTDHVREILARYNLLDQESRLPGVVARK